MGHYADEYAAREALERTIAVRVGDWRELNAEVARLRAEVARLRAAVASAEDCYHWRRNDCTPNESE